MKEIQNLLDRIAADHVSGSGRLLGQLMDGLLEISIKDSPLTLADKSILELILHDFLVNMRDFVVIRHFTDYLLNGIRNDSTKSYGNIFDMVLAYRKEWGTVQQRLAHLFLRHVQFAGKTVLTHSQSSTVQEIILTQNQAAETGIIQTESRPAMEGLSQAGILAEAGFRVTLITDTGYTPLLKNTDFVLLGADSVYADLFVNKCGTWAMALLARKHDIPVYVVADSRKVITESAPPELIATGNRPPKEIAEFIPEGVKPLNHYFEAIPTRTVTAFFTENRIIPGQEMPLTALGKK